MAFLENLVPCHRTADGIFVHGGLDPRIRRLEHQSAAALVWGVDDFLTDYRGREIVVYGHLDNAVVDATGWPTPRVGHRTIGIDTISHGVLTAVGLPRREIVQSRRHVVAGSAAGARRM
jgi:hypothetical protein